MSAFKHLKRDDCALPVTPKKVLGYFEFLCAEWIAKYYSNETEIKNNTSEKRLEDRENIKQILKYFMTEEDILKALMQKIPSPPQIKCNLKKEYASFYRTKYLPNLIYIANRRATFTQIFQQFNRLFKRIKTHHFSTFPNIIPEENAENIFRNLFSKDLFHIDKGSCEQEKRTAKIVDREQINQLMIDSELTNAKEE